MRDLDTRPVDSCLLLGSRCSSLVVLRAYVRWTFGSRTRATPVGDAGSPVVRRERTYIGAGTLLVTAGFSAFVMLSRQRPLAGASTLAAVGRDEVFVAARVLQG